MDHEEIYVSVQETSKLWGIPEKKIIYWCESGIIVDAKKNGSDWDIPINSSKKSARSLAMLENIYFICSAIIVISLILSLISCYAGMSSSDHFISDGAGNYVSSGKIVSGLQFLGFLVYVAMPFILHIISKAPKLSTIFKIILIILLTIITLVFICPFMWEPASNYNHGSFLGHDW